MTGIGDAWDAAIDALGGVPAAGSADDLVRRYAEPHRRYHTGSHILAVLRDCAWLAGELALGPIERAQIALAACAHDVVYDARPGDDERSSADWADAALTASGLDAAVVQRVRELVLMTLTHESAGADVAATTLLDADLAVLAGDAAEYAAYTTAVRAEYSFVSDAHWRSGRTDVLSGLFSRERIYLGEAAHRRWDAAARVNLQRELETLR